MSLRSAILGIFSGISLLFASCANDNDGSIDISPDMLNVTLAGITPVKVNFSANKDWYIRIVYQEGSSEKWLNVSPSLGNSGENTLTIQALSFNYSGEDRSADLLIRIPGDKQVVVSVLQPAVEKPLKLSRIVRTASGFTMMPGPYIIDLDYGEDDNVSAFYTSVPGSDEKQRYALSVSGNTGTIQYSIVKGEVSQNVSNLTFKMTDGVISEIGPLQYIVQDPNTSVNLFVSTYSYGFRYQGADAKRIKSITKNETITVEDGTTLETQRKETEYYYYVYNDLRIDSIYHVLPYVTASKEQRDTLVYKFNYGVSNSDLQEDNVTANVWDIVVMPDVQGNPFYSLTGYWLLNLTGARQGAFPLSATVERRMHTPAGIAAAWAHQYTYSYQRNDKGFPSLINTQLLYESGARNVSTSFTYVSDEEPGGELRK